MIKDTHFYNKESSSYSAKRYPAQARSYTQFFFKKRLDSVLRIIDKNYSKKNNQSLLEVGCADGVVMRDIYDNFSENFSTYTGIDISSGMIDQAQKSNEGRKIDFTVRTPGECFGSRTYDLIVEVGVINYTDLTKELSCAVKALNSNGLYVISLAGRGSLWDRFRKSETGFAHFMKYSEYENSIRALFTIESVDAVGLFIPLIWKVPVLARIIQNMKENVGKYIYPQLFHEKVYVLRKK